MRTVIALVALLGAFVLVGMVIAPAQPELRDWYLSTACPFLDQLSTDICAPVRRAAGPKTL